MFGTLVLLAATPATAAYKLMPANTPVAVAKSTLTVTPSAPWNRLPERQGKRAEGWTLDGAALNDLSFFAAIEDGKPLIRDADKKNRPLPRFSATMLPPDIVAFYETTLRVVTGAALFTTDSVEPAPFLGQQGFRFAYSFTAGDDVPRKGEGTAAVIGGKLYLITFEAPKTHYFDRDVAQVRTLVAGAKLGVGK